MSPGRAILVTGATGLIGAEVVARLSARHPVIAVTHRQSQVIRTDGSTVLSDEYGQCWSGGGVARLAADVREPGFGVAEQVLDKLGEAVGCIVHTAATIAFDAPEAEYRLVNVAGTEHAIDWHSDGTCPWSMSAPRMSVVGAAERSPRTSWIPDRNSATDMSGASAAPNNS